MDENFEREKQEIKNREMEMPDPGLPKLTEEAMELRERREKRRKRSEFGKGLLVGAASALALALVVGVVSTGLIIGSLRNGSNGSGSQEAGGWLSEQDQSSGTGEETEAAESLGSSLINMDLLSQAAVINSYLEEYFLYDVDQEKLRTGMLKGLLEALGDPYSEYYDADELASFQDSTEGEYVGIGAGVTQELSSGIVRISRPYEGTPSAEAGLLPGDILMTVDGTEVTGMELNRVVALIKGEEGTKVMLHIYRESQEEELDIAVERRTVEIPTVISKMLEDNIGYIEVTGFDGVTTNQFINAYEELQAQGMERVIVDLRNNGGGLVDVVEAMLDYLLPEGTIFYAKDKNGSKSMEYISDAEAALDIPMVVLVNEYTASAAEIFAGNIQEFGLGKVVGTTTYGKGVMQQMFYTNDEKTAAIKLTIADYYIHSDININGTGITPDVEEALNEEASTVVSMTLEQDNQLQKAIETVKAQ